MNRGALSHDMWLDRRRLAARQEATACEMTWGMTYLRECSFGEDDQQAGLERYVRQQRLFN